MRGRLLVVGAAAVIALVLGVVLGTSGGDDDPPTTTPTTGKPAADPVAQALAATAPVGAGWRERGVDLTSYQPEVFASSGAAAQLDRIKATGSTTVSIVVTWYQADKRSGDVQPDGAKSATDDGVRAIAAAARDRGMTIALKPHVDVLDGTFRGDIDPDDPAAWMRSYTGFVTHLADLATEVGATTFVIGTELETLSRRTDDWRALIDQVRQRYSGRLTYAANWVAEAERVKFWDALDLIGIDAYMPLTKDDPDPTVAELVRGWQPWRRRLASLSASVDRPVLFTELGYPSRLGAADRPSQEGDGAISQPAQARLYEAAFRVFEDVPWFHGVWWWDWPGDGGDPARDAGSYTPAGKLAERTMTRWLATAPAAAEPAAPGATTTEPAPAATEAAPPAVTVTTTVTVTTPAPAPPTGTGAP